VRSFARMMMLPVLLGGLAVVLVSMSIMELCEIPGARKAG
jgi:hypothetical protein